MKLRYGIVSTASITPRFIQAVQAYGDEVVAVASRDIEKAKQIQEQFHLAKAYGAYQALYEDDDIDVVYIASANHTHYAQAKTALMHHKHVVLEKPFTISSNEAFQLFEYAQKQECFLMEAQKSVFLPATIQLKEIIDKKELGNLYKVHMSSSFPNQYDEQHWMYKKYGGALYGSATYTLEYLMYLLDDPEIYAQAFGVIAKQGALIDVDMQIQINDTILVDSSISMRVKTKNQAIFYFDEGYVEIADYWKARALKIVDENGQETIQGFPVEFEMTYEVAHIHECIETNAMHSPIMSPERTIVCTQIVDDLIASLYEEEK